MAPAQKIMTWIAVALGGALGSLARHSVNLAFARLTETTTPYATATVNVVGSIAIGVLAGLTAGGKLHLTPALRTFIFVGILGGFTTFSSFMLDTLTLEHGRDHGLAAANVLFQVVIGLIAVFAGYAAAR
jgi:CrcB protein